MRQDWYPEQRQAFIDDMMSTLDTIPPQAGLVTDHSRQYVEYALHAIGCKNPSVRMIDELTTFMMGLFYLNPNIPERIFGWVYDKLCEDFTPRLGFFPVSHDKDPHHTTSGHVRRQIRRVTQEKCPRLTDTQVQELAATIVRELETDAAKPLDHSQDAWRRRAKGAGR